MTHCVYLKKIQIHYDISTTIYFTTIIIYILKYCNTTTSATTQDNQYVGHVQRALAGTMPTKATLDDDDERIKCIIIKYLIL